MQFFPTCYIPDTTVSQLSNECLKPFLPRGINGVFVHFKVWDGRFSSMASVRVLIRNSIDSGLIFTSPEYSASIPENISNITLVSVVSTVGHRLNEPLRYTLLNAGERFVIRPTCGVVLTTGVPFDREERDSYELVVEVSREDEILKVARVTVQVQVGVTRSL